jgi:hypothetical protein
MVVRHFVLNFSGFSGLFFLIALIENNFDRFFGDQAVFDHCIQPGFDSVDSLFFVDHFNDDGQIGGKSENRGGMQMAGFSKSADASQYGCPGQPLFSKHFGQIFVKGLPVVFIRFANKYSEQDGFRLLFHDQFPPRLVTSILPR